MFDGLLSAIQAYEQFQAAITESTRSLLESRQFWQQSTEALAHVEACAHPSERVRLLAAEVRHLRNHLERNIQTLAIEMLRDGSGTSHPLMRDINEAVPLLSDAALDILVNCETT